MWVNSETISFVDRELRLSQMEMSMWEDLKMI